MKSIIETFKPVMGYEGLYEVSDYGTVRSLNYNHTGKIGYLKSAKLSSGYLVVCLHFNKKQKNHRIHRLVWEAFNGPIPEGLQIDHINTDKEDNRLDNLRVVTCLENHHNPRTMTKYLETNQNKAKDPVWLAKNRESVINNHAKPVIQLDKSTGEVIRKWESMSEAERKLGICHAGISACCLNKQNTAGGFKWRFT